MLFQTMPTIKFSTLVTSLLLVVATCSTLLGEPANTPPEVVRHLTEMYAPAKLPPSGSPANQKDGLAHLLAIQRQQWAPAWVSSTFYDWRTVSQYRRQAGLHLGYDIALPAGTPVAAAWPGVVVAVIPWTDTEWGVAVRSDDGSEVTYGHISPLAHPGQKVSVGQIVGAVVHDHVDVKMRDASGRYVPFGDDKSGAAADYRPAPTVDRNSLLTTWLVAQSSADQAEEDLFLAKNATQKWELEHRSAERTIELLDRTLEKLREGDNDHLVSRKRLEQLKAERAEAQQVLTSVEKKRKLAPNQLEENYRISRANLEAVASWAKSEGLTWQDVQQLISKTIKTDQELQHKIESQKVAGNGSTLDIEELRERQKKGAERLEQLEALYKAGGLSRQEIEDQRLRQQLLEEELHLLERRNSR